MSDKVDVVALAKLARLDVSDEELATLEKEIPAILDFVETIKNVETGTDTPQPELRNVMRDDTVLHESGVYTDALMQAAPAQKGNRIVVKQVVSRKGK